MVQQEIQTWQFRKRRMHILPQACFGPVLPASGFYVRHAENIRFDNVQIFAQEDGVRPAYFFEDAHNILLDNPGFASKNDGQDLIRKVDCRNIIIELNIYSALYITLY